MSNAMLLDLLSARAAASENTAALEMIARMRAGNAAMTQPDSQELMARLNDSNPMLALLLQRMSQQQPGRDVKSGTVIEADEFRVSSLDDETPEPVADPSQLADALPASSADDTQDMRARVLALTDEVRALKDREELLAEALGACCLCWGEDRQCRACHGRGTPGYARPDVELFDELVLPAVQMMRAWRTNRAIKQPAAHLVDPRVAAASLPHS